MKHPMTEYSTQRLLVSPSMLAADFAHLETELQRIMEGGADLVHLDVMDAHFVPNLTVGPALIGAIRKYSLMPFDVHLMMTNPLKFIPDYAKAGADHITFHIECNDDPREVIATIRACGCSAGISLKPDTPVSALEPIINQVDLVLIMTVEPGFGGQSFMHHVVPKISETRKLLDSVSRNAHIEVDGGICAENVAEVVSAGANVLVAGTSVFKHPDGCAAAIATLHDAQKLLNTAMAR